MAYETTNNSSKSVLVSNNIYKTSSPILHISRIFGLAPFSIESRNGKQRKLQWSALFMLYSVLVGVVLVIFTFQGMLNELKMGDASFRMNGGTARYVSCADMIIVEIIVILGILNISTNLHKLCAFINCISEVDTTIEVTDVKEAKAVSIRALSLIIGGTTLLLMSDMYIWHSTAKKSNGGKFLVANYIAYHLSYIIVVLVECQYAHMAYCIKRRLKLINDNLKKINIKNSKEKSFRQNSLFGSFGNRRKVSDQILVKNGKILLETSPNDLILRLTKTYLQLCDAVDYINVIFGRVVLFVLVACLLHLTVTPYFFILELTGRQDGAFLVLQALWFLAHFFQLCLIVEPCNICLEEVNELNGLVCRLLVADISDNYKKQLEFLFAQLQYRQIEFSAFGLAVVDRSLVTTMAGAVTIYLVTIIQFQNAASS